MNKIPRFVKEYAAYQKRSIKEYDLMRMDYKEKAIKKVDGALRVLEKGLITVDEAMNLIMKCFE